jgi:hypothetical protein
MDNEGMNHDHQEELLNIVLSLHCDWAEASCNAASSIGAAGSLVLEVAATTG